MKKVFTLVAVLGISLSWLGCTGDQQPKAAPNAPAGATTPGGGAKSGGEAKPGGETKPAGGGEKKE